MGAYIHFREITGHETTEFDQSSKDICALIHSAFVAGGEREGEKFPDDFETFCNNLDQAEAILCLNELMSAIREIREKAGLPAEETEEERTKKKKPKSSTSKPKP